ncbi:hypothetical protein BBU94A_AD26 (plasmid) [Borreliella burgdorferi 94a]|nr:hypothetical protein BBU94A_AD26 [Borreliella burgdorferi 94a]
MITKLFDIGLNSCKLFVHTIYFIIKIKFPFNIFPPLI